MKRRRNNIRTVKVKDDKVKLLIPAYIDTLIHPDLLTGIFRTQDQLRNQHKYKNTEINR